MPGLQGRALHGLQAPPDARPLPARADVQDLAQVKTHGAIVQAFAPAHAAAPLGLDGEPDVPGAHIAGPQVAQVIGRGGVRVGLLLQAKGGKGIIKVLLFVMAGLWGVKLVARPEARNLG